MRWSRLRQLLENILIPDIGLRIHCSAYRRPNGPEIGRYWITLDGETIWEVPENFREEMGKSTANPVASEVTAVLREYLDTPRDELLTKHFEGDRWHLVDILRVADRRIGSRSLAKLDRDKLGAAAQRVLKRRERS